MQILLCAATHLEIQPTLDVLQERNGMHQFIFCTSGVGLTATTYALTRAICTQKPELILQAGIAGSFDESLPLGKTVVVKSETLGDTGVMENGSFKTLFDLGLLSSNQHPWQKGWLKNPYTELLKDTGLLQVPGASINEISTNPERIHYLKNNLGAVIESMEGAALHYVALQEGIPFLQLRSLSNYVGERDKRKWKLKEAIDSLNVDLQRILLKFLEQ
jgi:futalosine hydrolase